jgi:hypothetical protein
MFHLHKATMPPFLMFKTLFMKKHAPKPQQAPKSEPTSESLEQAVRELLTMNWID